MSSCTKFAAAIPTIAALTGGVAMDVDKIYSSSIEPASSVYKALWQVDFGNAQTQYKVTDENIEAIQKIEIIHKFASNLLENIEDLDPDFSKVIDENYWDLI
jgi:hypothetical protein